MIGTVFKIVTTQLALMPLGLVSGILTARFLGPSDRGLYTLLLLIPSTAAVFANIGLDSAAIYLHNRKKIDYELLFGNSVTYALGGGTLVAAGVWFGRSYLVDTFQAVSPIHLALALTTIPLRLLNNGLSALLRAKHDFAAYNRRIIFENVLTAVCNFLVLFVYRGGLTECLVVLPVVLGMISIWLLQDVRKHLTRFPRPQVNLFGPMWRYGTKSYASMLANHVHMKVDVYLVALYLTSAEIAFYSIGVRLAERILMVPTIASTVLFPKLSKASAHAAAELTAKVCRVTLFASTMTAAVIVLFGRTVISTLYGHDYVAAAGPMYLVVLGIGAVGLMRQLANFLKSDNKHQYSAYILGLGAVVNIGLNLLLIPRYRILGAASSSLLTYNLQALAFLLVFRRLTGLSWTKILVIRRSDLEELFRPLNRKPEVRTTTSPVETVTARTRT